MEFTRDLLVRLERNAESAKTLTREQAQRELDRIDSIGRNRSDIGSRKSGSHLPSFTQQKPKAP